MGTEQSYDHTYSSGTHNSKDSQTKKAITKLHKCLPPPYTEFILDHPTLMDCLQFLEKLCVKETGIDSGNTNNHIKETIEYKDKTQASQTTRK